MLCNGVITLPPKQKITKEIITDGAFELLKEQGIAGINARGVAAKLGCSTQPLFNCFENMDLLKQELIRKAKDMYNCRMQKALRSEIPFKSAGVCYITFAKEEPQLFRLLFMTDMENKTSSAFYLDENYTDIVDVMVAEYKLSREVCERLYRDMWVYTHGLATLIATGSAEFGNEKISELLTRVFKSLLANEKNPQKNGENV